MLTCSKPISPCRVASLGINFYLCYKYKLQRTHVTSQSCLLCNLLLPAMNPMLVTLNLTHQFLFKLILIILTFIVIQNDHANSGNAKHHVRGSAKGILTGSKFSIQIWFVHISSTLQPLGTKQRRFCTNVNKIEEILCKCEQNSKGSSFGKSQTTCQGFTPIIGMFVDQKYALSQFLD